MWNQIQSIGAIFGSMQTQFDTRGTTSSSYTMKRKSTSVLFVLNNSEVRFLSCIFGVYILSYAKSTYLIQARSHKIIFQKLVFIPVPER